VTRSLTVALTGAVIREVSHALHKLADAMDPAGNVGQAWGPRPTIVPDHVPDAWSVKW
jgi:hypothetical protein